MDYLLHLIDETTSHYDDKDNESYSMIQYMAVPMK